tara:strand:+ start:563 stop:721 length:159 start_codon:yes stop_codon:yes gene_type:complete
MIAKIIKDNRCSNYSNRLLKDKVVHDLMDVFKEDNDRFDEDKFLHACYLDDE